MAFPEQVPDDPITGQPTTAADNQLLSIRPRRVLAALAGLLVLALSACGTSGATSTTTAPPADQVGPTVTIQDLAYTPETLTVQAGATVTWVWREGPSPTTSKETTSAARSSPKGPSASASTSPARMSTSAPCTPT